MRNLKTIEKKVRAVLEKNEDARNDDMVLYLALCNACLKDAGAMPLAEIMTQHKYLGLPSFESVGRTRRKLQAQYPELMGNARVRRLREQDTPQAAGTVSRACREPPCSENESHGRESLSALCQRIERCLWTKKNALIRTMKSSRAVLSGVQSLSSVTIPTHPTLMCVGTARAAQIISGVITRMSLMLHGKS